MAPDVDSTVDSLNQEAIALARAGDLTGAVDNFRRGLALAPDRPDLLNNLGLTLIRSGAAEEAAACFDRALAVSPGFVDALHNKGLYLKARHRYVEAIGLFVDALLQEPERPDTLNACGFSHLMVGNVRTALLTYARLGELQPASRSDPELMTFRGYLVAILHKDEERLAAADSSLETLSDATAVYCRSRLKVYRGQVDEALTLLETATGQQAGLARVAANDPCFDQLFLTSQRFRTLIHSELGQPAVDTLRDLADRSATCRKNSQHKEAVEHAGKLLHDFAAVLGDRFLLVQTWQTLAESHFQLGQFREGVRGFQEVLRLIAATRGTNSLEFLDALDVVAENYRHAGNYTGAASFYQRAIEVARRTLGWAPNLARYLTNLAILNLSLGNYQETRLQYNEALDVIRAEPDTDYDDIVLLLNRLARLYELQGDYKHAESACEQAVDIARQQLGRDSNGLANSLNSLGRFYMVLGDARKASTLFAESVAIVERTKGRRSREFAGYLNDLALAIDAAGSHARAEKLLKQTLDIDPKTGDTPVPKHVTLLNLASVSVNTGSYLRAERLYKEALAIAPPTAGDFRRAVQLNLAILYHHRGRFAEAKTTYSRTIEAYTARPGAPHPDAIFVSANLARLYNDIDRRAKAISVLDDAVDRCDPIIDLLLTITSDTQRLAYLSRIQFCIEMYVAVVLQRFPKSRVYKAKALDLILRRKGIGFEASAMQREVLARQYASVAPKLRELRALRNEIGQKSILGPADGDEESQARVLAELNSTRARLEEELAQEIPDLPIEKSLAPFNRRTIAEAMPPGSALVEFVALATKQYRKRLNTPVSRHYVAFVLHADRPDDVTMVDLGSTAKIDRLIAAFRKAVMKITPESTAKTVGARLRRAVFDPLQASLKPKRKLILAGDGNLMLLPFEILPAADGGWLIDRYEISYVGSGRDMLRFRDGTHKQTAGRPLVVADPDFDMDNAASSPVEESGGRVTRSLDFNSANVKRFDRLKGAEEEGQQVGKHLGVRPLTRREALEGTVKSVRGPSPSILHVASHAFFLPQRKSSVSLAAVASEGLARLQRLENPMLRSGIALAGANLTLAGKRIAVHDAEDGVLTAADVASELELSSTDLVVLSACETGLGEVEVGEGVFGLSRSFGLAGAQTLVMSLWLVDDTITKEMMDLFYANLTAGLTCSEALKKARIAMKKYSAPYFWGAFICHGNPNSIPIRRNEAQPAGASA